MKGKNGEEWEFLTFDPEEICPLCSEPIRAGQAVGYVDERMIHAHCDTDNRRPAARPKSPPAP